MKHKKKLLGLAVLCGIAVYYLIPDTYPVYSAGKHYNPETQLFANGQPQRPVEDVVSAMWRMVVDESATHPPKPLPVVRPDWLEFLGDSPKSRFVWFGHSTLMMRLGKQTVLTDPVFGKRVSPVPVMMNRFQPPPAALDELPTPDVILISHNHYDHLEEDTIRLLAPQNNHFIVPLGVGEWLKKWGVPGNHITELDWWQKITRNGVTYTAVPARHDSGRSLTDRFTTLWAGYVVEYRNQRFYYSGDTSFGKHFDTIAARVGDIDIAFIENGQYNERWPDNHMFPEQTVEAAVKLKPKRFMPVHWGAYPMALHTWDDPVARSIPLARKRGLDVLTPLQGQVFDADTVTEEWYKDL